MISFSLLWGAAYSVIIFFTFTPLGFILNDQVNEAVRYHSEKQGKNIVEYLNEHDISTIDVKSTQYVVAIFSPLITSIFTNTLSFGMTATIAP